MRPQEILGLLDRVFGKMGLVLRGDVKWVLKGFGNECEEIGVLRKRAVDMVAMGGLYL